MGTEPPQGPVLNFSTPFHYPFLKEDSLITPPPSTSYPSLKTQLKPHTSLGPPALTALAHFIGSFSRNIFSEPFFGATYNNLYLL